MSRPIVINNAIATIAVMLRIRARLVPTCVFESFSKETLDICLDDKSIADTDVIFLLVSVVMVVGDVGVMFAVRIFLRVDITLAVVEIKHSSGKSSGHALQERQILS